MLTLTSFACGCAEIGQRTRAVRDRTLETITVEVPQSGAYADIEQNGIKLSIHASHRCVIRDDRRVLRTTITESVNKSPTTDWAFAGLGAGAIAAGTTILVDSKNVFPDDKTSRQYNPTGPNGARLYGYGLIAAGATALAVPIVDLVRANETKATRKVLLVEGDASTESRPCEQHPYVDATVRTRIESKVVRLGNTDSMGNLNVNLDESIADDAALPLRIGTLPLTLDGHVVGTFSLKPLIRIREERAWRALDLGSCQEPTTSTACDSVIQFIHRYPDGSRSEEAQQLLVEAEPKLEALRDEEHWRTVDIERCTKTRFDDPDDILAACSAVASYLDEFPRGIHAAQARAAIKTGQERAIALRNKLEREALAEEARQRAAERKKCISVCRMICSDVRFSSNPTGCLEGCIGVQCN